MNEPFQLAFVKREIERVKNSSIPISLTKVTIHTTDAMWMVKQVEMLQRIAAAWNSAKTKSKIEEFKKEKGNTIDIRI